MTEEFDPISGIISDVVAAIVALLLGFVVDPLNAILNPILGGTDENPVIDLND